MADRLLKFGDTIFPLGTSVESIERGRTIGSSKLARATGNVQTLGYRNGIRVGLRVPIYRGPLDLSEHRARLDTLREMLAVGPSRLYVYTDRFYRCCEPASEPEAIPATGINRIHDVSVQIVGPDPYQYSTTETSETWVPSSGVAHTINVASGGVAAAPTISLTVGGSGLETIAFTVSNDTTGEEFTLAGDVTAGDVIEIDCLLLRVLIGTTDYLSLFDGLFTSLALGNNSIAISWTSSSVTSATVTYNARWE